MHPGITRTASSSVSPQVDPKFLDRERAQAHTDLGRKCATASSQILHEAASSYKRSRPQVYIAIKAASPPAPPKKIRKGASPQRHAQPRTGTQGERAWVRGEEGSNPPVHREREGEGAILPPIYTQYLHFYNSY